MWLHQMKWFSSVRTFYSNKLSGELACARESRISSIRQPTGGGTLIFNASRFRSSRYHEPPKPLKPPCDEENGECRMLTRTSPRDSSCRKLPVIVGCS